MLPQTPRARFPLMTAALALSSALVSLSAQSISPRFSTNHIDRSVAPAADFYQFAVGNWHRTNPMPSDKSEWSAFGELDQQNSEQIHQLLQSLRATAKAPAKTAARLVADFYASAMDTNRLEQLGFQPIQPDLRRIESLRDPAALFQFLADLHERGAGGFFNVGVAPNAKNSSTYALQLNQGGLGLPDRDYYFKDEFAQQRTDYAQHIQRMLEMSGEVPSMAAQHARLVVEMETDLAKSSRTRTDLRDPNKNYNRYALADFIAKHPHTGWKGYFKTLRLAHAPEIIVGQPEFFMRVDELLVDRPLSQWKVYLKWHAIRSAAAYLNNAAEQAHFEFYGTKLSGQPAQEPRWQRSFRVIDGAIGEALGQLYVERYFPPAAKARVNDLVNNIRAVFLERLKQADWMSDSTRQKALAKFNRFTQKIGHPARFRDYSSVRVAPDDYFGNVQRATAFETRRQAARVGKKVDLTEWDMTPQTVNAYFNPLQNEIVFPAGILQPPFFDASMDDAVNYGAIGVVIGHEITHGYDDEGRQYDADGNLVDWWTEKDAKEFEARAKKVVQQYSNYEVLPGAKVNGELTLGENLADLGGTSIAFEALQRALAKDPAKRRNIDGFTPEQRFFLSLTQLWRTSTREAEARRRLVTDPHAPGRFRAIGAHVNMAEFFEAFDIRPGSPMWREPAIRAKVW